MDRIFGEIKRAIEEEMANQEAGRRGGSPRPSGPSGRDAERYEAWLQQEQDRLRGAPSTDEVQEPAWDERPRDGRERRRSQDGQERQRSRQRREEPIAEVRQRERLSQHDRSEARHQRRSDSVYDQRGGMSDARRLLAGDLRSRNGVRKAILLSEIIGKPVAMRSQDEHLISS